MLPCYYIYSDILSASLNLQSHTGERPVVKGLSYQERFIVLSHLQRVKVHAPEYQKYRQEILSIIVRGQYSYFVLL